MRTRLPARRPRVTLSAELLEDRSTPAVVLSPSTLPFGVVGSTYDQTIVASGATGPFTFQVTSGTLPTGLSLATAGDLTGTPTAVGDFDFTIAAANSANDTGSQSYTVHVYPMMVLAPTLLPNGEVGTAYTQTVTASGPPGPYTFSVTQGSLPTGLALASDGSVTGTPTAAGTFPFTVTATDTTGDFAFRNYIVKVAPQHSPVLVAVADGAGNVAVIDPSNGGVYLSFRPFDTAANQYVGQMSVALGDVNHDGTPDLIVATRGRRAGKVKVFDGAGIEAGTVILPTQTIFTAFPVDGYKQGLTVSAADVDGDGAADLAVATRTSSSVTTGALLPATVVVYAGANTGPGGGLTGARLGSFQPIGTATDGVYVAAGDVTGDGRAEVAISSSSRSMVKVFTRTNGVFTQLGTTLGDGSALAPGDGDGQLRLLRVGGGSTADAVTGSLNAATGTVNLRVFDKNGAQLASYAKGTGATYFAIDALDAGQNGNAKVMLARVTPGGGTTIDLLDPLTGAVTGTMNSFLTLSGKVTIAGST